MVSSKNASERRWAICHPGTGKVLGLITAANVAAAKTLFSIKRGVPLKTALALAAVPLFIAARWNAPQKEILA